MNVCVCFRRIKHLSIVNLFSSRTFFFHASRTFLKQMHRFKRLVVESSFISIVFSRDSNISNSSLDEFFTTMNENSSTSCVDLKSCASNESVDVSSKSSNDIELFASDNNNESIEIWKDIEFFTSTSWSFFTKHLATRSIISFERTSRFEFKARMISLTMIWMMNFWFDVECITRCVTILMIDFTSSFLKYCSINFQRIEKMITSINHQKKAWKFSSRFDDSFHLHKFIALFFDLMTQLLKELSFDDELI